MPEYTVSRCGEVLNRFQKSINGAKVLILGVAYKQDIDDYRESPALRVIEEFQKRGADISYYDPWVAQYKYKGEIYQGLKELNPDVLSKADIVVITTAHTNVDYEMVQKYAKAIFDTKNVMKNISKRENIEVL